MAENEQRLRNWKLTLAYDGTGYSGWQVQPGEATVQGELQAALKRVTGEGPLPQGSGRTDAGVHALGQVASFELEANIPEDNLQRALNRTLPEAMRVLEARRVESGFHARHSAVAKTYEYRIFRGETCPPVLARYVHACPWRLDLGALNTAARMFEGEHDFSSFAATDPDLASREKAKTRMDEEDLLELQARTGKVGGVRRILASSWEERDSEYGKVLIYRVRGNGFLHHMVRNLVGTMVDVGRGYRRVEEIPEILAARARSAAGPTAPAQGLFLHSVEYGKEGTRD